MAEVIIYLRTSTEEQNPENQLADCKSINSYGEAEVIEDKQSAWKEEKDRPGFELLKKRIYTNKVKHLIIWDFDRLYRNRQRFKEFLELLKVCKVQLHSFRQQWMDNLHKIPEPFNFMMHDFMIQLFGWIAEEESSKKSDRIKIAFANHKGEKWGRPGIKEKTASEVVKLWQEGKSMREISKVVFYWNKSNHRKNVSIGAVHKIIKDFQAKNPQQRVSSTSIPFLNNSRALKGGDDHGTRTRV